MFTWSIAKSAEAMFSRLAIKRLCKFLLKKKLGKFILGDIDLNQLDVQLSAGTIQLSDLAVNVDYINQKFNVATVSVKEGSIGSLVVTMPWKDGGCEIEVDDLEIVLTPRQTNIFQDESETSSSCQSKKNYSSHHCRKLENDAVNGGLENASVDVHEGVKTIAKMVKWLLTSFHVKVKNLIVAFDPSMWEEMKEGLCRTAVLRISEVECRTQISEDASSNSGNAQRDFLGLNQLINFVKFEGAAIELLHMDDVDQTPPQCSPVTPYGDWFSGNHSFGSMTTIITGEKGGFSGNLKLSIPWKNGSLDVHKVDADVHIDPLVLRIQPTTLRYFICIWNLFKGMGAKSEGHSGASNSHSSNLDSCLLAFCKEPLGNEGFDTGCSPCAEKEFATNALLSESPLISDWVSKKQKDKTEEETDFEASMDQFFECVDELRNSQSALGNSAVWNWTGSMFSAITAASNLASGSLHVPSEQQHVETNFKAAIDKISLLFSFTDEDQKDSWNAKDAQANDDYQFHYLCAKFTDLYFIFQASPRETNFEATVYHIELVDHFRAKNDLMDPKFHGLDFNLESQMILIQQMQNGVQSALQNFCASSEDAFDHPYNYGADFLPNIQNLDGCCHVANRKEVISVTFLKTSGVGQGQITMNSLSSDSSLMGPTSFSLKLPRFIIWVNFGLLSTLLNFMKEMENCIETTSVGNSYPSKLQTNKFLGESRKESLRGNVFLQDARIILCFPFKGGEYSNSYIFCDQFIAIDFYSPTLGGKEVRAAKPMPAPTIPKKRYVVAASCSLHLNFPDLHVYFITSALKKNVECGFCSGLEPSFSVDNIMSITQGTGCQSVISMFWQEGIRSVPGMAKKAKLFAENTEREDNFMGRDREFASVTTVKNMADFDTSTKPEIISSSRFFLHAHLSPVTINLAKSHYENLHDLTHQVIDCFSCMVSDPGGINKEIPLFQTSILVECDSVTISVTAEAVGNVKPSIQYELPGSWHSFVLQVHRFELLSVENIGGIRSASFLRVSHGQGNMWGSITEGLPKEFLLISCSDSSMGRGDGEGSNVLSSMHSGTDFVLFWDPESNKNYTSITVRCATIVAIGGRLDWLNTIISFFSLPSSELEQAGDNSPRQTHGSSFLLNLIDICLSYEPYLKKLEAEDDLDPVSSPQKINEVIPEQYVACLLAASSFILSNRTTVDCTAADYKIILQDLGLLLCSLSESKVIGNTYSVEHLSKIGYVKVAQEAHVEALVRTNCQNGHMWEVECTDSHIDLNTCHDTASGLIRLADQLQKLFAPDMQESIVHLQTRWNNVQQVHDNNDGCTLSTNFSPPVSEMCGPSVDRQNKRGPVNLMDEICEDVFHLDGNSDGQAKFFESRLCAVGAGSSLDEQCNLTVNGSSYNLPLAGSVPVVGLEAGGAPLQENFPELIEEYILSDLRPFSELTLKSQPPNDILKCKTGAKEEAQIGNGRWYGESSLRILENHVSKVNEQTNVPQLVEGESSSSDTEYDDCRKVVGCVLLKNMNIIWRMYAGSDWSNSERTVQQYANNNGRDTTISLELELFEIGFQYDVFTDGGICASRLALSIQDFCLNDNSRNAPWKQVLGLDHSKKYPRKFSSKALKLDMEAVRPDPSIPLEENRLSIALLPLRLHLHQNQLDFLISFFGGKSSQADLSQSATSPGPSERGKSTKKSAILGSNTISDEAFLTYFQKFDIQPVLIRVDYCPHHVDLAALRGGKYVELVNLVPWKGIELQLKHVQAVGVYGWGSVCETIVGDWLEDISQSQVHKLLKGLPPIRSLVAVGSGAAKLVAAPVKSYRKDRRLLKGMQRGTIAFLRSISLEAIGLGVHLAAGAHDVLLQAEYILTSSPPSVPWPVENRMTTNVRSNQPNDARQGIQQAFESIGDGLGKSASALVQTPLKKYQRGAGVGSALVTAVQGAPVAAIAPASAVVRAAHCAFLGFRNSLDPERKRESLEKHLGRSLSPKNSNNRCEPSVDNVHIGSRLPIFFSSEDKSESDVNTQLGF
ncbi:autophagy-related 2 [Olea europaea subsp. europaea]|uniref:Autophagy-related protein 2 n=2 Tax=Olea europaea subsp. europaea TaxID=158383 RepID=A0A8S0SF41_OLEEU|nr:autophagy-related 2 [Olea europaea subsp. europaea]